MKLARFSLGILPLALLMASGCTDAPTGIAPGEAKFDNGRIRDGVKLWEPRRPRIPGRWREEEGLRSARETEDYARRSPAVAAGGGLVPRA
jgi:hypothetical protein